MFTRNHFWATLLVVAPTATQAQVAHYVSSDDAGVQITAQTTSATCAQPGTLTLRAELTDAGAPDIVVALQLQSSSSAVNAVNTIAVETVRNAHPSSRIGVSIFGPIGASNPVLLSRYDTQPPSRSEVEARLYAASTGVGVAIPASSIQSLIDAQFPVGTPAVRRRELILIVMSVADGSPAVCDPVDTGAAALRAALVNRGIGVTILRSGASTFGTCLPSSPQRDVIGSSKAPPFAGLALGAAMMHTVTADVASGTSVLSSSVDVKAGGVASISAGQLRWVVPRVTYAAGAQLVLRVPVNAEPVTLSATTSTHVARPTPTPLPDLLVPSGECPGCLPGSYLPSNGLACTACPAGTSNPYAGAVGIDSCVTCPIGTFSLASQATCTACPGGTYGIDAGATAVAQCAKCPVGTSSITVGAVSDSVCESCPAGTYGAQPGKATCTSCPPGSWSAATGATSASTCVLCAAGTYSTNDRGTSAATCTACPVGSYSTSAGSLRCLRCPSGTTTVSTGATSPSACIGCPPGKVMTTTPAGPTCVDCPAGTYKTSGGSSCVSCPGGTYSTTVGATLPSVCLKCPAGTFSAATGASSIATCQDCPDFPIGTYQPDAGALTCIACTGPQSFYGSEPRATSLSQCHAYAYSPGNSCLAGTYFTGNTCVNCPAGTYSLPGATECRACPPGYSSAPGAATRVLDCFACPPGSASVNGVCVTCPAGTAAPSVASASCTPCPVGSFSDDAGSTECLPCGLGFSTPDAGATLCELCAWANGGVGLANCAACSVGSVLNVDEQCMACSPGSISPVSGGFECVTCPSGTFASASTQSCDPCPAGTFALEGSTSCSACATGRASDQGAAGCMACPPPQRSPTDCRRDACSGAFVTDEADDTELPLQLPDAGCLVAVCSGGARVIQPNNARCNDGRSCTTDTCSAAGACVFTETAACNVPDAGPSTGGGQGGGGASTGGGGGSSATGGGGASSTGGGGGSMSTGGGGGSMSTGGGGGTSSTGGGGGSMSTGGGGGASSAGGGGGSMSTGGGGEPASPATCSCDGAGGAVALLGLLALAGVRRRNDRKKQRG